MAANVTEAPPLFDVDIQDVDYDYLFVLHSIFVPAGLYLTFAGCRLPTVSMAFVGFVLGGSVGADLGWYFTQTHAVALAAGGGLGIILSLVLICLEMVMFMFLGALAAFLLFNHVVAPAASTYMADPTVKYSVMGVSVVLGAVVARYTKASVIIVVTAFFGAYFAVNGIGYFLYDYRLTWLWLLEDDPKFVCKDGMCLSFYGMWAFSFFLGMLFQFYCFQKPRNKRERERAERRQARRRRHRRDSGSDMDESDTFSDSEWEREQQRRRRKRRQMQRYSRSHLLPASFSESDDSLEASEEGRGRRGRSTSASLPPAASRASDREYEMHSLAQATSSTANSNAAIIADDPLSSSSSGDVYVPKVDPVRLGGRKKGRTKRGSRRYR